MRLAINARWLSAVWFISFPKSFSGGRRDRDFLTRACYLTSAVICLLLAFTGSGWGAAIGIMVFRLAVSFFSPLQTQMQNERIVTAERATILSVYAVIIDSVGIGTNLIYGALAEKSLTAALVSGAVLCAVGLGFVEMGK